MKKALLLILVFCFISIVSNAQIRKNVYYQSYIEQYKDLAIEQMKRYKIPASITLAQGLFESAAGRSDLARNGNNHFGIKCHGWTGRTTYHDDDERNECFRAYDNVFQSYEDHSRFLANHSRYARLFRLSPIDYKGWARGLKACGYATNPKYADKLIGIIELYELYRYDSADKYDKFLAKHNSKDKPAVQGGLLHPIYMYNKNYYIVARQGDSFKSIGKEVGISYRKIAKYNERSHKDYIVPGEVIYLKKKRSRADKKFKDRTHVVKPGESMYSISQFYGMRVKYLYKKNDLTPDYQIKAGDKLRVY